MILYHGTSYANIAEILKHGLEPSVGWGELGTTEGVFLSISPHLASSWAKIAYLHYLQEISEDGEYVSVDGEELFIGRAEENYYDRYFGSDEGHIAVLKVTIPQEFYKNLRADMEQADSCGFPGSELEWELSLKMIGDVLYKGNIPVEWIEIFSLYPHDV